MRSILSFVMAAFAAILLLPNTALAEWHEAQSTNFVIYADDSERDLRAFAGQLEQYHAAMEIVTGLDLPPPSPSNRVTVYVVGDMSGIRRLTGSDMIAGFYIPRAGRSAAFVPRVRQGRRSDFSMTVLLHEYAHHFMLSNSRFPPPRWYSEGGAEFFASARFGEDGSLTLGLPAEHRYRELFYADDIPVEQMLDPANMSRRWREQFNNFYGKSWLLFHMLIFDEDWRGKMSPYLTELMNGMPAREAAESAFGNLGRLDNALDNYKRKPSLTSMRFEDGQLDAGAITVRELSDGEARMMDVRIVSARGVDQEQAQGVLGEARSIAASYPQDAGVLDWLAEAEYDAGNDAEAIAVADRALAIDPGRVNAYVQKGYALFRMAALIEDDAEARVAAYRAAAEPFLDLNAVENNHPLPLYYYYRSFSQSGRRPGDAARAGLARAVEIAPFDRGIRLALVRMYLSEDNFPAARSALLPIAYNPHGGAFADVALELLGLIDEGELGEGGGEDLYALLEEAMQPDEEEGEDGDDEDGED